MWIIILECRNVQPFNNNKFPRKRIEMCFESMHCNRTISQYYWRIQFTWIQFNWNLFFVYKSVNVKRRSFTKFIFSTRTYTHTHYWIFILVTYIYISNKQSGEKRGKFYRNTENSVLLRSILQYNRCIRVFLWFVYVIRFPKIKSKCVWWFFFLSHD